MTLAGKSLQDWILQKQYWEQYLWKVCVEKSVLDAADYDQVYRYFLEDAGIIEKTDRHKITSIGNISEIGVKTPKIVLEEIHSFDNINALPKDQQVAFSEQLTVIYGENGSGKSGISRLFGNACFFRGKKDLLPNVKMQTASKPNAGFRLKLDAVSTLEYKYTLGDNIQDLHRFYVFDNSSSLVHLDSANSVNFIPAKLIIFDKVKIAIAEVEQKINRERTTRFKENPVKPLFLNDNDEIAIFFENLNVNTPDIAIDVNSKYDTQDELLLIEIKNQLLEKEKLDIPKVKAVLKNEIANLKNLKSVLQKLLRNINSEKQDGLNTLIQSTRDKRELTKKLGVEIFAHENFKSIGNDRWLQLITVAKELYDYEAQFMLDPSVCILCHQGLTEKPKALFESYWEFLKNTAKKEYETLMETIQKAVTWSEGQLSTFPSFETTEIAINILEKENPNFLNKLKETFGAMKPVIEHWISCLKELSKSDIMHPNISLKELDDFIAKKEKMEADLKDPADEITKLKREIARLNSKKTASRLRTKINEYKAYLVWQSKIDKINFSTIKTSLTKKRTDSFNSDVAIGYAKVFSNECKLLNGNFGIQIYTKGEAQNSFKGLKLSFAENYAPSRILSEGEQKVCSIADFLTEVTLDTNICGIVFDDPVTSLDHERKDLISERLVNESKKRQVIILTHDIVFLLSLQSHAKKNVVDCKTHTIRKDGNEPGFIESDSPWIALSMTQRVKYLKKELQRIGALYNKGDAAVYRREFKQWCLFLREAWERSIEETLFNGVVRRFEPSIQSQKLAKVKITDDHKKAVYVGMTESSKWAHDQAATLNAPPPSPEIANGWIKNLEKFIDEFK